MLIRFALDANDRLVRLDDAPRGEGLRCPACHDRVTPRREHERLGHRVRGHFTHVGVSGGGACEGYAHRTAKLLIAKRWQDARLVPACTACGIYDKRGALSLPSEGTAVTEHPIAAGEFAARPDVLIFTPEGQPHTAIEIFDSSAVKGSAAKVYAALGIFCAEVDATAVLAAFETSPPKEIYCRRVLPTPPRCSRCASTKRIEPTKTRWLVGVAPVRRDGAPAERVHVTLPPGRLYGSDVHLFAPRKKPDGR